jgi:hypothetical protein
MQGLPCRTDQHESLEGDRDSLGYKAVARSQGGQQLGRNSAKSRPLMLLGYTFIEPDQLLIGWRRRPVTLLSMHTLKAQDQKQRCIARNQLEVV